MNRKTTFLTTSILSAVFFCVLFGPAGCEPGNTGAANSRPPPEL